MAKQAAAKSRTIEGAFVDGKYRVYRCAANHIHLDIVQEGGPPVEFVFDPYEGYDLAQDILRAFDVAVGITALPERGPRMF